MEKKKRCDCLQGKIEMFRENNWIVLRAQFAGDGHFVWDIMMKYFYNPSYNKEIL